MECKFIKVKGTWRDVANSARTTIGLESGDGEPSPNWKRRMLLCEHSPIRQIVIKAKWYDLKSWISVHLVRHKIGIEHYVKTQRSDRTGVNRDDLPQSNFVEHEIDSDAQAIINISRRRLCNQASKETREAWQAYLESFKESERELYHVCVPDCIYRGWCFEFTSCGYHKTKEFKKKLKLYRSWINE